MKFNEKIKVLRNASHLTQEELAERLDVSRQAITKWESGEGTPDINNLKEISGLFNISIDELVKDEEPLNTERRLKNILVREIPIDHTKHFDLKINKAGVVNLLPSPEEIVKLEILSDEILNLSPFFETVLDNCKYDRFDLKVKAKRFAKPDDYEINIYLPQKYIDEIELATEAKQLNIKNLDLNKLEYDGELKYLNVTGSKGKIVLNTSKSDIEATYDKFDGTLEVNTVHSVARVKLPAGTEYQLVKKGAKNEFVNAVHTETSKNVIELNGIGSKLIIE